MASEPHLANLSSETSDKYEPYLYETLASPVVKCGMIMLDAVFSSGQSISETIVFAMYKYAHLVQRIFYLSNPTFSKSTQTLLPNTYVEFKMAFQNNPSVYIQKLKELMGYGTPGYPGNVAQQIRYGLFIFFDIQTNMIISGNVLVSKIIPDSPEPQPTIRFVNEIWGVAADPLYMKSGAGASLILAGLYLSDFIFKELYSNDAHIQTLYGNNDKEDDPNLISPYLTVELQVAKDSFPFIDFMERFTFYARNGFSYASGEINTIYPNNTFANNISLSSLEFYSKYLDGYTTTKVKYLANNSESSLEEWVSMYRLSLPNPDPSRLIWFKTKPMSMFNYDTLLENLKLVFYKIKRSEVVGPAPIQTGFISHSGYITTTNGISTFKVPPKMEIVIINSPGYSTTMATVSKSWNMNAKYMRNVSIEYLKKLFPPFKTSIRHGHEVVPFDTEHAFTHATSGGILFDIINNVNNTHEYIQIHCYSAGDSCPDLRLTCKLGGPTTDHAAPLFGAYALSNPTSYKSLQMTNNISKLNSIEEYLFSSTDQNKAALASSGMQWPDSQFRYFPDKQFLMQNGYSPTSVKQYENTLQTLVTVGTDNTYRLCIFSCGVTTDATDANIKQYYNKRNNHKIQVSIAEYEKRINKLGEAIYDIYDMNIAAYGLSPASAAIQSIAPIMPMMQAFSGRSSGPRGSRGFRKVSKGSKGSRGSRKSSKGSRGSRKLSKGSKGSRSSRGSRKPSKGSRGSRKSSKGSRGSRKPSKGSRGSRKPSKGSRGSRKLSKGYKASTNSLSNL